MKASRIFSTPSPPEVERIPSYQLLPLPAGWEIVHMSGVILFAERSTATLTGIDPRMPHPPPLKRRIANFFLQRKKKSCSNSDSVRGEVVTGPVLPADVPRHFCSYEVMEQRHAMMVAASKELRPGLVITPEEPKQYTSAQSDDDDDDDDDESDTHSLDLYDLRNVQRHPSGIP